MHKCARRPLWVWCACMCVNPPCSASASRVWDEDPPRRWHYSVPTPAVCKRLLHQQHFTPGRRGQPIHTLFTHPCLLSITSPHPSSAPCMPLIVWPPWAHSTSRHIWGTQRCYKYFWRASRMKTTLPINCYREGCCYVSPPSPWHRSIWLEEPEATIAADSSPW